MKRKTQRFIATISATILLCTTIALPAAQASSNNSYFNSNINTTEGEINDDFINAFKDAIITYQDEFEDPSVADELLDTIKHNELNSNSAIQQRGKVTITAKYGAKLLKSKMNKIGEKAWNKMVKKVETVSGTKLVWFHWKGVNQVIDFLAESGDTIENSLTKFLKGKGMNSTVAKYTAKAIVLVFF